jgi:glycosyltransferase involved in cell wall biosynthesis
MNSTPPPAFLFLGQLRMGGVETMCLKAMKRLVARDRYVFAESSEGELQELIDRRVEVIGSFNLAAVARFIDKSLLSARNGEGTAITIVSMQPWQLIRAALLNRMLCARGHRVRGFHLVTHSRAFFFDSRLPLLRRLFRRAFFSAPRPSTYFMNLAAREAHQRFWNTDLSDYPVITLPISDPAAAWAARDGAGLRVVSVGRLVHFKGYNRAVPEVVRSLRADGINVSWDIWGDGEDRELIAGAIQQANMGDQVRLMGQLPYERFDETIAGYDLFVGMGTALLEAGRIGMPAITAVEGAVEDTYGFLCDTPLDSVGDQVEGATRLPLGEVVASYAHATVSERADIGLACRRSAIERSSSVDDFVNAVESAAPWALARSDRTWLALGSLAFALFRIRHTIAPMR